jgi:hypothetical protein
MGAGFSGGHAKSRAIGDTAPALRGGASTGPVLGESVRDTGLRLRRYSSGRELDRGMLIEALRSSPQALLIVDAFDRICFASEAAVALLGKSSEALRQSLLRDHVVMPARDGQIEPTVVARSALGPCTLPLALADGREVLARMNVLRDHWGDPAHACLVLEAVTHAGAGVAALDSLGRLAGELAHDVNNQLSAALNYVFILRRRLSAVEPIGTHLAELEAAVWRASGLASTLRVVGRKRNAERECLNLGDAVRGLEPLLRHLARGVHVEIDCGAEPQPVHAPLAYVEQVIVIVALLLLARAPTDSVLKVSTRRIQAEGGAASDDTTPVPTAPAVHGGTSWARVALELVGDRAPAPARSNSNGHSTHGGLRRALKRCGARMGHDARAVWVDFK